MARSYTVTETGLTDYVRNLRTLRKLAPKALESSLEKCAKYLISEVKPQVPRRTGRAQDSVQARPSRSKVFIEGGGSKAPWYPWIDFGGRVGINKSVVRPFIKQGRYLYPTMQSRQPQMEKILLAGLVELGGNAGIEVK